MLNLLGPTRLMRMHINAMKEKLMYLHTKQQLMSIQSNMAE